MFLNPFEPQLRTMNAITIATTYYTNIYSYTTFIDVNYVQRACSDLK